MRLIIDTELIKDLLEFEWGYEGIRDDLDRLFRENGTPIPDNATVCDIDAIRREIEDLYIITNPASDPYDGGYYTALIDVRRIIDNYTKGDTDV